MFEGDEEAALPATIVAELPRIEVGGEEEAAAEEAALDEDEEDCEEGGDDVGGLVFCVPVAPERVTLSERRGQDGSLA